MNNSDAIPGLSALQDCIGHQFDNTNLLVRALTHRSASQPHLERLEFLGDAVLSLVISEQLFRQFRDADEGQLSRWRAYLVCGSSLKRIARDWHLQSYVRVGNGERDNGGNIRSESIAGNAVEAIIGAAFIDAGWEVAKHVVQEAWAGLSQDLPSGDMRDSKSRLQELTQARGQGLPDYHSIDQGVGKSPRFSVCCFVRGKSVGSGAGNRKKEAEIKAAEQALKHLQNDDEEPENT